MGLPYKKVTVRIQFKEPVTFYTFPTFIFHSVLGKGLRRLVCLFRGKPCTSCSLRYTCSYSWLFETPIDKDNPVLPGRNRGAHPYVLYFEPDTYPASSGGDLSLTLSGKGVEYLPYLYFALKKGGEYGIFKQRTQFTIQDVLHEGRSILSGPERIDVKTPPSAWDINELNVIKKESFTVKFISPYRMKIQGKYTDRITFYDLLLSLYDRAEILLSLYGHTALSSLFGKQKLTDLVEKTKVTETKQHWEDYTYYSSRQKNKLKLGGVTGSMSVLGNIDSQVLSLLHFGKIFHGGKNTAFGFGRIEFK